jgi:hypothetical protein
VQDRIHARDRYALMLRERRVHHPYPEAIMNEKSWLKP